MDENIHNVLTTASYKTLGIPAWSYDQPMLTVSKGNDVNEYSTLVLS